MLLERVITMTPPPQSPDNLPDKLVFIIQYKV
jgi:hypothetical protein